MLSNTQTAFLFFPFRQSQNIVGADVVKTAQGDQMADGQLVGGALVTGVHGLGGAQDLGHLPLGHIMVFPQVPDSFYIGILYRWSSSYQMVQL